MDWKAVAQIAAPFAPTLGKILGGFIPFPGGAILGEWAGNAIATALGVPATPEAVGGAIQTMPADELNARLAAVESEAKARYDMMARVAEAEARDRTAQSQAINETQRAEIATGVSFWHWRHQIGYLVLFQGYCWTFAGAAALFGRTDVASIVALMNASTVFTGGLFALLGYVAQDTTKLKTVAITGEAPPSMTDNVVKAVKSVVGKVPAKPAVKQTQILGRD